MKELRTTMKRVFKSIDGLSEEMVLAPEEVVRDYYDILIVDEAHRLYQEIICQALIYIQNLIELMKRSWEIKYKEILQIIRS